MIGKRDALNDMEYMTQLVHAQGVTFVDMVPSVLKLYMELSVAPFPPSVRMVYAGGEALSAVLARAMVS